MDGDCSLTLRYPWDTPPAHGDAIEVAEGVLWLRFPLPMKLDHVNVYALDDGDGWTVIDTGFNSKSMRELWQNVMAGPLGGKPIHRVVATHHHPDHIGLAGWLQSEYGAELVTTRTSWVFGRMLTLDEQAEMPPETVEFHRRSGMDPEILAERMAERPFNFADMVAPLPLGFTRIKQGDVFRMGGRDWDIHIGNGHAPEHATFWSRDDNLVITGDQIISSISPIIGVYPTEPMADPLGEWLESCERLSALVRPDQLALPGHKLPFVGLPLRMRQLIDNHTSALDRILDQLDTPKPAPDLFLPLFKRNIGKSEYGMALSETVAHINYLYLAGSVTRTLGENGAWLYQRKG